MKKTIAIARVWAPAIFAALLGIAIGMVAGTWTLAHAAGPLEIPYANHATSPTGLTVAVEGTLYANWHNHRDLPGSTVNGFYDACESGVNYAEQFANYGLMVRGKLTVTNVDTGETYRTRGHWVTGGDTRAPLKTEVCAGVWTIIWADEIEIITPDAPMAYRLTFATDVDLQTGDLIGIEVVGADLL